MNIRNKLLLVFLLIAILSIGIVGLLSFESAKTALEEDAFNQLDSIVSLTERNIDTYYDKFREDLVIAQSFPLITDNLPIIIEFDNDHTNPEWIQAKKELDSLFPLLWKERELEDVMFTNKEGTVVYVSNPLHAQEDIGNKLVSEDPTIYGREEMYLTSIFYNSVTEDNSQLLTAPIKDENGTFVGLIVFELSINDLYELIGDRTGLGETGESMLAQAIENEMVVLTPLRFNPDAALQFRIPIGSDNATKMQEVVLGGSGRGIFVNYNGKEAIAVWKYLPSFDWGLMAMIDTAEAFEPETKLRGIVLIIGLIVLLLVGLLAIYISHNISQPIVKLRDAAVKIGKGKLGTKIEIKSKDEIGELGREFSRMTLKLKKSNDDLKKSYKELKGLDKAKTEFIMLASHELKSPLVPIMGYTELMLKGELGKTSKKQKEKLKIILRNTENLKNLINHLLDLSKLEMNKIKLDKKMNDLPMLITHVLKDLAPLSKEKNAALTLHSPKKVMLSYDEEEMRKIITNLLINAITYSKGKKNNIRISVTEEEKRVIIKIKDQGRGIAREKLPKIFDKFYRVSEAVTSPESGVGVGLSVVKGLVELHGGTITVTSKHGVGTEFTVIIPKKR